MSEAPTAPDAQLVAERVLYELLGRRWVWPAMRALEAHQDSHVINLQGRPVRTVLSVARYGTTLEEASYSIMNGFQLKQANWYPSYSSNRGWGLQNGRMVNYAAGVVCDLTERPVVVDYVYGSPPPTQVELAIKALKDELEKAYNGERCKLPQRVTSISREGISMQLIDPREFLDKGLTGISEVDLAITIFNRGRAKMRSGVFGPTTLPPQRLSTEEYVEDAP